MIVSAAMLAIGGLIGLVLGSYAVTAALRFVRAEPSSMGRSHCDSCGGTLTFAQTVPVVSYVRARGACETCRARIDPTHLAGELSGLLVGAMAMTLQPALRVPLTGMLGLTLIAASTIDWKIGRLPDQLTGAVGLLAILLAALKSTTALELGLIAAAAAFLLLQGLRIAARALRRDPGLGFGDVKLICALAPWLGLATPWMLAAAAVAGLVLMAIVRPANGRLAFGPALALAGWFAGIGGEWGAWPTTL